MSNFGFFDLRLVHAYHIALEESRSAVGAKELLRNARQYPSLVEAVADCSIVVGTTTAAGRELHLPLLSLEAMGDRMKGSGQAAILFGSEKFGLSNEDMSHCHVLVRIPTRDEHGSMNLGQAVAVTLYELIRDPSRETTLSMKHTAPQEALTRMEQLLTEALSESGYLLQTATHAKLRRMIRRLELPPRDAVMWQGMFRQILWKLRGGGRAPDRIGDNQKEK